MRNLLVLSLLLLTACQTAQSKTVIPDTITSTPDMVEQNATWAIANSEFSFESDGVTLKGTLHFPQRDEDDRSRLPGVVIAHDFGPMGRDGIMRHAFGADLPVEVAVYRTIAEQLARHGFVVLLYDKRTCVTGGAIWCTYPRTHLEPYQDRIGEVLLEDLNSAVDALKARPEVDQSRMTVIGHGHGADLALALKTPLWKRVAVGWAPVSPANLISHQFDASIKALQSVIAGRNDAETDEMKRQLARLEKDRLLFQEGQQRIHVGETLDDLLGLSSAAWLSLEKVHIAAVEAINDEHAFILGGKDFDLPADAEDRLRKEGADQNVILLSPMGHLMVNLEGDSTTVSPDLIDALLTWLE